MAPTFFDKAKNVAQQALDEARKGIDEGQNKLDELQTKKQTEKLLVSLGAALYAEQRSGGSRADVDAALRALDAHVQQVGVVGFPDAAVTPGPATAGPAPTAAGDAPPPPPPPPAPPTSPPPPPSAG